MTAYYNEHEKFAAAWLRELIAAGQIAPGDVDERDIQDVRPTDLTGYTQCHFFAGIGGWSLALRKAGIPDSRRVWTGSCPCQPFSAAGKRAGTADERHLWPYWFWLIQQCGPETVLGEQVASLDALAWLDIVQSDTEAAGYTFWASDLCAAGVGAPHIRQRLWFVADATSERRSWRASDAAESTGRGFVEASCVAGGMGNAIGARLEGHGGLSCIHDQEEWEEPIGHRSEIGELGDPGPVNGFWRDADWLACRDGKWRPVEPGTFPLAHGVPNRVGALRGYGNAICPEAGEIFIRAVM